MFSTAPSSPWEGSEWEHVLVETTRSGALTRSGFLAKWAYTTMKVRDACNALRREAPRMRHSSSGRRAAVPVRPTERNTHREKHQLTG